MEQTPIEEFKKVTEAEKFYNTKWSIQVRDNLYYCDEYKHTPIELIKFANEYTLELQAKHKEDKKADIIKAYDKGQRNQMLWSMDECVLTDKQIKQGHNAPKTGHDYYQANHVTPVKD